MRAEGAAVVEWFAQRSLVATPVSQGPSVLIVDESEVAGVVVRRLWHTALTIEPAPSPRTGSTLVLQAEGSVGVGLVGSAADLGAGDALVYPDADLVGLRVARPTARIEVASTHRLFEEPARLPGADDGPWWRGVGTNVNTV